MYKELLLETIKETNELPLDYMNPEYKNYTLEEIEDYDGNFLLRIIFDNGGSSGFAKEKYSFSNITEDQKELVYKSAIKHFIECGMRDEEERLSFAIIKR
jgi:hypothetical protein